jgi:hypothetical protein
MAFRKSVGVLILSVGDGILSGERRGVKDVARERRNRWIIDNGRDCHDANRPCMSTTVRIRT